MKRDSDKIFNFDKTQLKYELKNILEGKSQIGQGNIIRAVTRFYRENERAGRKAQKAASTKEEETKILTTFIEKEDLWYKSHISDKDYVSEGAEQKVFRAEDGKSVIKLNDSIFYLTWLDYFNSIQVHNLLFPDTKYELLGFKKEQHTLYAVVQQPYVSSNAQTDLLDLRKFLEANGFRHKKNNDFYNEGLGIILEDLHDENVLTNNGIPFFIDSAIYLSKIPKDSK